MATVPRPRRGAGVTDDAIERIRELVASGEWQAGMRLPREADLAKQLGLSRNSLREAVRALSLARVLEVRQGDGTYVSSLEPGELLEPTLSATHLLRGRTVLELFEVRRLLEPRGQLVGGHRSHRPGQARQLAQYVVAQAAKSIDALGPEGSLLVGSVARPPGVLDDYDRRVVVLHPAGRGQQLIRMDHGLHQ